MIGFCTVIGKIYHSPCFPIYVKELREWSSKQNRMLEEHGVALIIIRR